MKHDIRKWPAERISQWALWLIVGVVAVVFALFFLVGYDHPSDDAGAFNAPVLTTAVLIMQYVLLAVAVVVLGVAVVRSVRMRSKNDRVQNGVPTARIVLGVIVGTAVLLALTFIVGSTDTVTINGAPYADKFWLRVADMFVNSSLSLLLASIAAAVFGATRYRRKSRKD